VLALVDFRTDAGPDLFVYVVPRARTTGGVGGEPATASGPRNFALMANLWTAPAGCWRPLERRRHIE